ncbi:MAG: hypothetical protein ABMA00_17845 [Gemmatimonas sp.]
MVSSLAACASGGASSATSTPASSVTSASITGSVDAADAPFVGSTKSRKFYPSGCGMAKLIKPAERVGFASIKDAESAGFARDQFGTDCK